MENMQMMLEPIRASLHQVGAFLPRVLLAIAILILGWLVAKAARFATVRMLRAINFNIVTEKAGIDNFLRQGGGATDTTNVLGMLVYWLVLLAALMIAFNSMDLAYVTDLIGRVLLFVPKVMVAVLILAFGAYFARFVGAAVTTYCENVGISDADVLGRFAQYAIMVFVILVALDQLGLGDIIRQTFLILTAAIGLALALAFGIGGSKRAAELLERWSRRTPDTRRTRHSQPQGPEDPH
jgi:Conserved TM helix